MFLNLSFRFSITLRRIMPNLETILRNQELITKELSSLKTEVNYLENLYNQLKNCGEDPSKNLIEENAYLEKQINFTKQELIRLEVARGVQQIPLPKHHSTSAGLESCLNTVAKDDVKIEPSTNLQPVASDQTVNQSKKREKPSKQDNKDKSKPPTKPEAAGEGPVDVSRLDMRVGKIVDVKKHPDADSLYVERIDVGKDQPITVVSGLVKHIPIEEMQGRNVVLLCNLKPAKMRGVTSEAMVMCASTPDKVEILQPPEGSVPGDIVHVDGFPPNPDPVLNPKKKIFETVAPDLKTDLSFRATYKGHVWTIPGKGIVTCASLSGVNIK